MGLKNATGHPGYAAVTNVNEFHAKMRQMMDGNRAKKAPSGDRRPPEVPP